jgi:hypothetical protein
MTSRIDEIEAAMNARVLNVPIPHCREFLAQISAVLVLDILDNGVPAMNKTKMSDAGHQQQLLLTSPHC